MDIYHYIPREIIDFLLVGVLSLLIGFEQRKHHDDENDDAHLWLFGTDRTFTFIGLLGYVLYKADPNFHILFICGFLIVGVLLSINYYNKIKNHQKYGLTTTILALTTYCLPLILLTQPLWLTLLLVVTILILTEQKENLVSFSQKISSDEFITLGKFIVFIGIILPLLPDKPISPTIKVSPFQIWMAVVVVSGISYASYLLKKFMFPHSGLLVSAILGGIYSSTATTVIVARKEHKENIGRQAISALMLTNAMMYLRVIILTMLFSRSVSSVAIIPLAVLFITALLLALLAGDVRIHKQNGTATQNTNEAIASKNPLEFKIGVIFAILFVVFAILTEYVLKNYGTMGISLLAFISGVSDIDPFLIGLLQQPDIVVTTAVLAMLNATNSNNMLKMGFAISLSGPRLRTRIIAVYSILLAVGIGASVVFYLMSV